MSEIERNGISYRTCLKCRYYKYIGSIPGIVYRFFSEKIYFFTPNFIYTLNYYFIHVHSSNYRIAVFTQAYFPGIYDGWYYEFIVRFYYIFINKNLCITCLLQCTSELQTPITFLFVNENIKCGYAFS